MTCEYHYCPNCDRSFRDDCMSFEGKTVAELEAKIARIPALLDVAKAANVLVNEFAWSAVTADCDEARVYLQSLIDSTRETLRKLEEQNG